MEGSQCRADGFVDPADDPRDTELLIGADERSTLEEYLRYQRETLKS